MASSPNWLTEDNIPKEMEHVAKLIKKKFEKVDVDEYISKFKQGELLDSEVEKEFWNSMIRECEAVWDKQEDKPIDLIPSYIVFDLISFGKDSQRARILEDIGIKLTPKDKKRGAIGAINRLRKHFYKSTVRKNIKELVDFIMLQTFKKMEQGNSMEEAITEVIEDHGLFGLWYPAATMINDPSETSAWINLLKGMYPYNYCSSLIDLFIFYKENEFEEIKKKPVTNDNQVSLKNIKKEHKQIKNKMDKKVKETSELKRKVYQLKVEKKNLEGEIHQLYQESLLEIEELKAQLEAEREYFSQVMGDMYEKIYNLYEKSEPEINQDKLSLQGKSVAVIGSDKIRYFREIIEKYEGNLEFVSENDLSLVEGAISRSEVVFYVKEFGGHPLKNKAFSSAKKYNVPFIYLNTKGMSGFERVLLAYLKTPNMSFHYNSTY